MYSIPMLHILLLLLFLLLLLIYFEISVENIYKQKALNMCEKQQP